MILFCRTKSVREQPESNKLAKQSGDVISFFLLIGVKKQQTKILLLRFAVFKVIIERDKMAQYFPDFTIDKLLKHVS